MAEFITNVILDFKARTEDLRNVNETADKMEDLGEQTQKAEASTLSLGKAFKALGGAFVITKGIQALRQLTAQSIQLADQQLKSQAKVQQAILSTGKAAGRSLDELTKQATKLQQKTLFGDEQILNQSTAQLLTFTNIAGEQFDKTVEVALDLATVLDGDLQSATIQLGKALNDPVANLSALSRSGIQFSDQQKKVIKELATTNRLAEAQTLILDELNRQYGGQAAAAARVGLGAWQQYQNTLGDIKEEIGKLLLDGLQPVIQSMKQGAINTLEFVSALDPLSNQLEKERIDLKAAGLEILSYNERSDKRVKLIQELKLQYPQYLKDVNADTITNRELRDVLAEVNSKLLDRIVIQKATENLEDAESKLLKTQSKRAEVVNDIFTELVKLDRSQNDYNLTIKESDIRGNSLSKTINATKEAIAFLNEEIQRVDEVNPVQSFKDTGVASEGLRSTLNFLNNSLNRLNELTKQGALNNKELNELEQIRQKLIEQLGLDTQDLNEITQDYNETLGETASQSEFVAGSLAFLSNRVSELNEELQNIVVGSEEFRLKLREINQAQNELNDAQKEYNDLLEKFETTDVTPTSAKQALDEIQSAIDQIEEPVKIDIEVDSPETIKEKLERITNEISTVFSSLSDTVGTLLAPANQAIEDLINNLDQQIDKQNEAVEEAAKIADKGNAQQLALEERRLDELLAAREEAQRRQERLERAQLALNNIVTLSNSIAAIAKAAGQTGVGAIAIVPLIASTIAAAISTLQSFIPQFAEGTNRVTGPGTETSDSIHAMLSKNERVMTADQNRRIGFNTPNEQIVRDLEAYRKIQGISPLSLGYKPPQLAISAKDLRPQNEDMKREFKAMQSELKQIKEAIISKPVPGLTVTSRGIFKSWSTISNKESRFNSDSRT